MSKQDRIDAIDRSLESVRQYLKDDGGDVEVIDITDQDVVLVRLKGACVECPQSYMTMKAGIEQTVRKAFPDITGVEAVNANGVRP